MPENDSPQPRPRRISVLAVLSVLAFAVAIIMTILNVESRDSHSGEPSDIIGLVPWAAAAILGIVALMAIARSGGRLRGRFGAGFAIVASTLALGMVAFGMGSRVLVHGGFCRTNLKGLANALLVYAEDNDEMLPESTKWCDLLVTKADISARSLICEWSNTKIGESSYAMNIAAAGKKPDEIPPDMVLLFEIGPAERDFVRDFPLAQRQYVIDANQTDSEYVRVNLVCKSRWNEVCGIERAGSDTHDGGGSVLFGNHEVRFVRKKALPSLRWSIDVDPPPSPLRSTIGGYELRVAIPNAIAYTVAILTVIVLIRHYRSSFALKVVMALGSAGAGFLGGAFSEVHHAAAAGSFGAMVGTAFGFHAGICYGAFGGDFLARIQTNKDRWLGAVSLGMATGVIVSTLVHLALAIHYEDMQGGLPIIAGLPFGIVAGAILGGIACAFIPATDKPVAETAHD